jgi:hypothetical protein
MTISKQTISKEVYLARRKELITMINASYVKDYERMYNYLYELYILEKTQNPEFTKRQLARELVMPEKTVYNILVYMDAPEEIKSKVSKGEVSLVKATRIMTHIGNSSPKEFMIKTFDYVIKNNMTEEEIDKFVKKDGITTLRMNQEREYKNIWNIYRDISVGTLKINRTLKHIKEIHANNVASTIEMLTTLRKNIDNSLIILKKMKVK